jgi:Zn-dependent metalloprotease
MKIAIAAITSLLFLALSNQVVSAQTDDEEGSSSLLHTHLRKTQVATGNASSSRDKPFLMSPVANRGKGRVQVKGQLGKIDVSNVAAAQAGARRILETLGISSPNNKYVPKNTKTEHVRFIQQIHGMDVEGASLMVHSDVNGNVVAINGELLDDSNVPSAKPDIDATFAIKIALAESRVPFEFHNQCSTPSLTIVRAIDDGAAHLAWTCTVRYDVAGEDGFVTPYNDKIFAHADGQAGLIQIHPLITVNENLQLSTKNKMQNILNEQHPYHQWRRCNQRCAQQCHCNVQLLLYKVQSGLHQ